MLQAAYQLRVALRDLKPAIYRDLLVDPGITLRKLHSVIQAAMGWDDEHLYGFALPTSGTQRYWRVPAQRRFEPKSASGGWGEPSPSDAKYRVQDVLTAPKQKLLYSTTSAMTGSTPSPSPPWVRPKAPCRACSRPKTVARPKTAAGHPALRTGHRCGTTNSTRSTPLRWISWENTNPAGSTSSACNARSANWRPNHAPQKSSSLETLCPRPPTRVRGPRTL